ncbi:MAG: hypothetical protein MJ250_08255 [Alphaproteobacteria bacterium]|nr:hypothetical protein [Alphaproteobacteria bacterium]
MNNVVEKNIEKNKNNPVIELTEEEMSTIIAGSEQSFSNYIKAGNSVASSNKPSLV